MASFMQLLPTETEVHVLLDALKLYVKQPDGLNRDDEIAAWHLIATITEKAMR
jgi:hypothetical protein